MCNCVYNVTSFDKLTVYSLYSQRESANFISVRKLWPHISWPTFVSYLSTQCLEWSTY